MQILVSLNLNDYPTYIPHSFVQRFLPKTVVVKESPFSKDSNKNIPVSGLNCSISYTLNEPLTSSYVLKACHSNRVVPAGDNSEADAHYICFEKSSSLEHLHAIKENLAIRTADCLAVAFCFEDKNCFIGALAHAGWRGLSSGILQNTFDKIMQEALRLGYKVQDFLQNLHIHIAPAIFAVSYECGEDVLQALMQHKDLLLQKYQNQDSLNDLYLELIDFKKDKSFKSLIETKHNSLTSINSNTVKIFPDLQLLAALECVISGIPERNIEILRENTYSHPVLFSFREATHKKTDKSLRQWTHLRLPLVNRDL
ncbi:laccase domain-containing protein [Fluviispira vulneris]|uniref:laccase domain-containing protein n=1 Tax=Fluviispira vulneris TaxID=2763012 RepID=UPI0016470981|nr:laccase domain-containing protein [Fluviispira vulneris]